ncbi:MAG TPA: 4-alpha-glucanotransferase [Ohtaekwangia sp.]|nr:4-alpha-glucanotransferase [Ohtaekwangia sp.]
MPENKRKQKPFIEQRGAGILLHISGLPSAFGIGDLGPEAYRFADFLQRSRQKYWQVLPLNPTTAAAGYSPYSAVSAMAGNALLISPEKLADEGLLNRSILRQYMIPSAGKVDFRKAEQAKEKLFADAYSNFNNGSFASLQKRFMTFSKREAYWLDDYALYEVIKKSQQGKPWYAWPDDLKKRKKTALERFTRENAAGLDYERWLQFIFSWQWADLKKYCAGAGIRFFGDLPFYLSYDAADVWSQRELFSLDSAGNPKGVAGVPPDYFNKNGQRWGMPVFRWDVLKETNYAWWMQRLRKNTELYDILRLDHFRAFSDYWEVPAKEKTAVKGQWKPGPGASFFKRAEQDLQHLPFVAEDLGEITEDVYILRDKFDLPGMKVLQFAFGDNMPTSEHAPHNYIPNSVAYTGTHDNNTTRGWYRKDADRATLKRLVDYADRDVRESTVHLVMGQLAYASVANTVILPMQDVLGLDESARMNTPASLKNNWLWRMEKGALTLGIQNLLKKWTVTYNR